MSRLIADAVLRPAASGWVRSLVMSEDRRLVGAGDEVKASIGALFDSVADDYDDVVDYFGPFGRRLAEAADVPPGADVLDLACGRGAVFVYTLPAS